MTPVLTRINGQTASDASVGDVASRAVQAAWRAQPAWSSVPLGQRLNRIRQVARLLAARSGEFVSAIKLPHRTSPTETLVAELIPLADACQFLYRQGDRILRPRKLGRRGQPRWLYGVEQIVRREPLGVVLVIGPGNYPLFLAGVQIVQALAAGNAVLVKPAPGGKAVLELLAQAIHDAGVPDDVLRILPDSTSAAEAAIAAGVARIVLTGSWQTGQTVLAQAASTLTPCTLELSGCDAMFVLEGADCRRAAKAVAFGLRFNGSATCIAPRRVFVHRSLEAEFGELLKRETQELAPVAVSPTVFRSLRPLVEDAIHQGAVPWVGSQAAVDPSAESMSPLVLTEVAASMPLVQADLFAPICALLRFDSVEEALAANALCPFALGASVFGPVSEAHSLAERVDAGCVTVNDVIAPTADPRLPFASRRRSGYGVTRGAEGLLEMTQVKTISIRRRGWLMHLRPASDDDPQLLEAILQAQHAAGRRQRVMGWYRAIRLGLRRVARPESSKGVENGTR